MLLCVMMLSCSSDHSGAEHFTEIADVQSADAESGNENIISNTVKADSLSSQAKMAGDIGLRLDSIRYVKLMTQLFPLDSITKDTTSLLITYIPNLVLTDSLAHTTDSLKVILSEGKGSSKFETAVAKPYNSKQNKNTDSRHNNASIWIIIAVVFISICGIVLILFIKRKKSSQNSKKLFKISSNLELFSKSSSKLPWTPINDSGNKKYFVKVKVSWKSKDIKREDVIDWFVKNYYNQYTKELDIKAIRKIINSLTNENEHSLYIPLIPESDNSGNCYSGTIEIPKKNKKDKEAKKKTYIFKAIPDTIQNFGACVDNERVYDDNLYKHSGTDEMGSEERPSETEPQSESQIPYEQIQADFIAERKNSNNLRSALAQLEANVNKKIDDAISPLKIENQGLKKENVDLNHRNTILSDNNGRLERDLQTATVTIGNLNSKLQLTEQYFAVHEECKEFAGNLSDFFSLLHLAEKKTIQTAQTLSAVDDGQKAAIDAISNFSKVIADCKYLNEIEYNTSLIAQTGFCLKSSAINKRLDSQPDVAKRSDDYRYFVYDKLGFIMGEAVKMTDIIGHLDISHKVDFSLISGVKSMTTELITSVKSLGFEVNYVELFTPEANYKDIEIDSMADIQGVAKDMITAVSTMAVNYGSSNKKTIVTVQQ